MKTSSETLVERGDAEAQDVRRAEIGHHPFGDQRLDQRRRRPDGGARSGCRGAPRSPGRDYLEAAAGAAALQQVDEEVAQRERLLAEQHQVGFVEDFERGVERGEREDRRGAAGEPFDARRRLIVRAEGEGVGVAEPAGQRVAARFLQVASDIEESRGARPAVEEFVAAADREVGAGGPQLDRQGAGAVGEVPAGEGAVRVGRGAESLSCRKARRCENRRASSRPPPPRATGPPPARGPAASRTSVAPPGRAARRGLGRCRGRSGNAPSWQRIDPAGRAAAPVAAASSLKRFTEVESATSTSSGPAPTRRAMLAARRGRPARSSRRRSRRPSAGRPIPARPPGAAAAGWPSTAGRASCRRNRRGRGGSSKNARQGASGSWWSRLHGLFVGRLRCAGRQLLVHPSSGGVLGSRPHRLGYQPRRDFSCSASWLPAPSAKSAPSWSPPSAPATARKTWSLPTCGCRRSSSWPATPPSSSST